MDTAIIENVRTISSDSGRLNTRRKAENPSEHEHEDIEASESEDAVTLNLSSTSAGSTPSDPKVTSGESNEREGEKQKSTREELEQGSKQLERALNQSEIRFNVLTAENKTGEFHFQVVERDTGRILRQFPPDELPDLLSKAKQGGGLVIDSLA